MSMMASTDPIPFVSDSRKKAGTIINAPTMNVRKILPRGSGCLRSWRSQKESHSIGGKNPKRKAYKRGMTLVYNEQLIVDRNWRGEEKFDLSIIFV